MAALAGGNVRVGIKDKLMLGPGVFATDGRLVERAKTIFAALGARVLGPAAMPKKRKPRTH